MAFDLRPSSIVLYAFTLGLMSLFNVWSHEINALRTQDPVTIYWANIAVLTACYGYGFTIGKPDGDEAADQNQPQWLKFIYKVGYRIPSGFVDCSACASRGVELPLAVE